MKTNARITLAILTVILTLSCTARTGQEKPGEASAHATSAMAAPTDATGVNADDKHTADYITRRLNSIYSDVYTNQLDLLENDRKYMSAEYNRLQDQALEIARRTEDLIIDADHWVQGQEWTDPKMTVRRVYDISALSATAEVNITKFGGTPDESVDDITLQLVFERGDWYIDNMIQEFEGEILNEKAWYQFYIDNPVQ